jgi:catechol 2,3-dioxygenase-like lactoylglutathione lyase family enzyme
MITYRHHHVSIKTLSLQAAIDFYKLLGFAEIYRYSDAALAIVHLLGSGGLVELFCYSDSTSFRTPANDVPHSNRIGLDHFSMQVDDIGAAYNELKSFAISEVRAGRTNIDYFFISDPDGNRIEIVRDARGLALGAKKEVVK